MSTVKTIKDHGRYRVIEFDGIKIERFDRVIVVTRSIDGIPSPPDFFSLEDFLGALGLKRLNSDNSLLEDQLW